MIWCSPLTGLVKLSDKFTTGSSIMPQKRNPDAAELVRAKSGRIFGALQALLVVMKGLPLAYQKDMQEDKEAAMEALSALMLCVEAMSGMVTDLTPDAAHPIEQLLLVSDSMGHRSCLQSEDTRSLYNTLVGYIQGSRCRRRLPTSNNNCGR